MYWIRSFIADFDHYHHARHGRYPESVFDYRNLLNFLSIDDLQGQRPSGWWNRSHDIDLLIGTHRFGYANYNAIKNCDEYGFADLERSTRIFIRHALSGFPDFRCHHSPTEEAASPDHGSRERI